MIIGPYSSQVHMTPPRRGGGKNKLFIGVKKVPLVPRENFSKNEGRQDPGWSRIQSTDHADANGSSISAHAMRLIQLPTA